MEATSPALPPVHLHPLADTDAFLDIIRQRRVRNAEECVPLSRPRDCAAVLTCRWPPGADSGGGCPARLETLC